MKQSDYESFDAYLGDIIKRARMAKGYSLRGFSRRIDRSHSTVIKYERGEIPLNATMIKFIFDLLNINCADVFDNYKTKSK